MHPPDGIDALLSRLLKPDVPQALDGDDAAFLASLMTQVRGGQAAVVLVQAPPNGLQCFFSNIPPKEAVTMLNRAIEFVHSQMDEDAVG